MKSKNDATEKPRIPYELPDNETHRNIFRQRVGTCFSSQFLEDTAEFFEEENETNKKHDDWSGDQGYNENGVMQVLFTNARLKSIEKDLILMIVCFGSVGGGRIMGNGSRRGVVQGGGLRIRVLSGFCCLEVHPRHVRLATTSCRSFRLWLLSDQPLDQAPKGQVSELPFVGYSWHFLRKQCNQNLQGVSPSKPLTVPKAFEPLARKWRCLIPMEGMLDYGNGEYVWLVVEPSDEVQVKAHVSELEQSPVDEEQGQVTADKSGKPFEYLESQVTANGSETCEKSNLR
ncbi:hypothetical protein Tco_0588554 [Tanacetum coccineum]